MAMTTMGTGCVWSSLEDPVVGEGAAAAAAVALGAEEEEGAAMTEAVAVVAEVPTEDEVSAGAVVVAEEEAPVAVVTMGEAVVAAIDRERSDPSTASWSRDCPTPGRGKISRTTCGRRATSVSRTRTRTALEWWSSCAATT